MAFDLTLYTYGNGDFVYEVMTSANFFFGHAFSFFKLAAMLSLIAFAFEATGILPSRGYDWTKFIRVYGILMIFVITPFTGKIVVHDVITNQDQTFNYSQKKLPFGMIVPIAWTTSAMYKLIMLYQQNFEIDENLNYTYSGMNFGSNFIQALDTANSYDANFNYNFDNYMQNCGFPVMYRQGVVSELQSSTDIFATLKKYAKNSRFVQQTDFQQGKDINVMSCSDAINAIINYYNANSNKIMQSNATRMGVPSTQYTRFMASANATATELLHISQGASTAMKQAIAQNMIMASLKNGAQATGNGSLALAAYDAEAFQSYKKSSELSGSAAARTVPILVATGYILLFMLYPVMIFLAIVMGSYSAIKTFFQMLLAISLIPLLYEIFNFVVTFYLQKKLGVMIVGSGYSYDTSASIYSFTDNMIIAANYLAASTPILAYSLVSGSTNALTSVFSHINDPAKTRADQAGDEYSKGNMNLGGANIDNASYGNITSNNLNDGNQTLSNMSGYNDTQRTISHDNLTANTRSVNNDTHDTLTAYNTTTHNKSSHNNTVGNDSTNTINRNTRNEDNITAHQHNTAPTNTFGAGSTTQVMSDGSRVVGSSDGNKYYQAPPNATQGVTHNQTYSKSDMDNYTAAQSHTTTAQQNLQNSFKDSTNFVNTYGTAQQKQEMAQLQSKIALGGEAAVEAGKKGYELTASISGAGDSTSSHSAIDQKTFNQQKSHSLDSLNDTTKSYSDAYSTLETAGKTLQSGMTENTTVTAPANNEFNYALQKSGGNVEQATKLMQNDNFHKEYAQRVSGSKFSPASSTPHSITGKHVQANTFGATGSTNNQATMNEQNKKHQEAYDNSNKNNSADAHSGALGNALHNALDSGKNAAIEVGQSLETLVKPFTDGNNPKK